MIGFADPGSRTGDRLSVGALFDRGMLRRRGPWLPVSGEPLAGGPGVEIQFCLDVAAGVVRRASFRATTCVTLVAFAESLAERITGMALADAVRVTPSDLLEDFPEVPSVKHGGAVLAVRALHSAIAAAVRRGPESSTPQPERESP